MGEKGINERLAVIETLVTDIKDRLFGKDGIIEKHEKAINNLNMWQWRFAGAMSAVLISIDIYLRMTK